MVGEAVQEIPTVLLVAAVEIVGVPGGEGGVTVEASVVTDSAPLGAEGVVPMTASTV